MLIRKLFIPALLAVAPTPALAQGAAQQQAPATMTKAEMTKNVDARFAAIDTNKDGVLVKDEIAAVQSKVLEQAQAARQQRMEAEFKKLDTDNNGALSLAEFRLAAPPVRAGETPDQVLAEIDANKDGRVTAIEYRTTPLANFDKLDANKDGTLTAQEVAAARQ